MILTQKQPRFNMPAANPAALHHRRHPSAPPAVVVQPTRTPGLLSLQKPARQSPARAQQQRQSQQRTTPKSKSPPATDPAAPAPAAKLDEHEDTKQSNVPSKEKDHRGRLQAKQPREKAAKRSASNSSPGSGRARGGHNRQSSPPIPHSQVEAPSTPTPDQSFSNLFDPFLDSSDSDSAPSARSSPAKGARNVPAPPTLAARPSGKLAKRRNHAPASPSPTKAIPVPKQPAKAQDHGLSRSAPIPSSMPPKRPAATKRPSTHSLVSFPTFPVCDDTEDDMRTPRPPAMSLPLDDGPRTAPLSSVGGAQFPFEAQPTTPVRNHRRVPSDGMFAMDDSESDELRALFGLFRKAAAETPVSGGFKPFYASSTFQNSPSPDDLPPPPF